MYTAVQPLTTTRHYPMDVKYQVKPAPIDYTNLYIKNLDTAVESAHLFTYFRAFGMIVSARVMKHPQTNRSRGFGFVSFSRMEDAVMAKEKMNGQPIGTKHIMVAFHEPKKIKEVYTPLYPEKRMREETFRQHMPEKINKNNNHTITRQISAPVHQNGLFVPIYDTNKGLRRSGSAESMVTTTTKKCPLLKRQLIMDAITKLDIQEDNIQDILDMIMTLDKKYLATCLFNKALLKLAVKKAKFQLDLFEEEEKHESVFLPNIEIPPKRSRAIPIVAPTDAGDKLKKESNDVKVEIEKFLKTLKNLPLFEQKQILGDRLFPLVKATGIKHAPRVTICLLDSIAISELAHIMYDQKTLQALVEKTKQ